MILYLDITVRNEDQKKNAFIFRNHHFKDRASELLQQLQVQIEDRNNKMKQQTMQSLFP